jgi:hypothetical protein
MDASSLESLSVEKLLQQIGPQARDGVPPHIRQEMLKIIQDFIVKHVQIKG